MDDEDDRTIYIYAVDEMQGRIIGREGRNIRMLERLTYTTFTFDTKNWVTVTGHPADVEMVRKTLWDLMKEGRIHPTRIEEALRGVSSKDDLEFLNNRIEEFRRETLRKETSKR